jgi:hypothetical protein
MLPRLVIHLTIVLFLPTVFFLMVPLLLEIIKKQATISRSSVEAKIRAMSFVTAEIT